MKDGDLRTLFRNKLRQFQWTSIETAGSASGVPDAEYCTPEGIQGWVEFKVTKIYYVHIKPLQVSWIDRRARYGGNVWIAVRRVPIAQIHTGVDELWLMHGRQAQALEKGGLQNTRAIRWFGGPSSWNYDQIADILSRKLDI